MLLFLPFQHAQSPVFQRNVDFLTTFRAQDQILATVNKFLSSVCSDRDFEQKEKQACIKTYWAGTMPYSVFSTWFLKEGKIKQFHFWVLEFLNWRKIRFSLEVVRRPYCRNLGLNLKCMFLFNNCSLHVPNWCNKFNSFP